MTVEYALSIRQPWATLLVHGVKTIEVRRWSTPKRGRIIIHASRAADDREHGWSLITPEMEATSRCRGGIIGAAKLIECVTYKTREEFAADQPDHLNEPDWFQPPQMYGFRFANSKRIAFCQYPGCVRFFPVSQKRARDA